MITPSNGIGPGILGPGDQSQPHFWTTVQPTSTGYLAIVYFKTRGMGERPIRYEYSADRRKIERFVRQVPKNIRAYVGEWILLNTEQRPQCVSRDEIPADAIVYDFVKEARKRGLEVLQ